MLFHQVWRSNLYPFLSFKTCSCPKIFIWFHILLAIPVLRLGLYSDGETLTVEHWIDGITWSYVGDVNTF